MKIRRLLHILGSTPPRSFARRALTRTLRLVDEHRRRRADLAGPTYTPSPHARDLQSYWPHVAAPLTHHELAALRETTEHYLKHRFDLLGSGWVSVHHGMHCRGLASDWYEPRTAPDVDPQGHWLAGRINAANLDHARHTWRLVDPGYVPIDWQLDFKSGYRWSEATWYRDIRFGHVPGADVKVPWELARMQHLPRLAWAHALATTGVQGFHRPEVYAREFRNQVIDFIATNPPRFGVNWFSTMDVALRAANWLVAYDWLQSAGATWDAEFDTTFIDSIEAHGRHIVENLEWHPTWRGNHYLANVVGLLFVAAYLPPSAESHAWLAFATGQLVAEVDCQFSADGSNVEASTSYHRLSAEMVAFGTALALAAWPRRRDDVERYDHRLIPRRLGLAPAPLPRYALEHNHADSPFPPWYFERLERMAEFTVHVTKPSGRIHQVGDNDSGRFLNLQPAYERLTTREAKTRFANLATYDELPASASYWVEDHLDHRSLVAAIGGLIDREDFARFGGAGRIETWLLSQLIGGKKLPWSLSTGQRRQTVEAHIGTEQQWRELQYRLTTDGRLHHHVQRIALPDAQILHDLNRVAYADFGLFIWRSPRFYLAVRCASQSLKGPGAHAHNDQLAVELSIDEQNVIADPGSYLYTSDPHQRNRYRSVTAHRAPQPRAPREPGRIDLGLFELPGQARAACHYFGTRGFAGEYRGFGRPVYRIVELQPAAVVIIDYADRSVALCNAGSYDRGNEQPMRCPFSAGYGWIDAAHPAPPAPTTGNAHADHCQRMITEDVHPA